MLYVYHVLTDTLFMSVRTLTADKGTASYLCSGETPMFVAQVVFVLQLVQFRLTSQHHNNLVCFYLSHNMFNAG
jgi:hypothetical protein